MDRYWLLTWTTYGTWLPGDERGFVGPVDDNSGSWEIHNIPGTPYDAGVMELQRHAKSAMNGSAICLTADQARTVAKQMQETALFRQWELAAFAVMRNHVHTVVGVGGDPDPANLLRDFKSYASGRLSRKWKKPANGGWWTESGSRRILSSQAAISGAVRYVSEQSHPLVVYVDPKYRERLSDRPDPGERPA